MKQDVPICVIKKIRPSATTARLACSIRSKGADLGISQHSVFIMNSHNNKIKHSDRRLYVDISISFSPYYPFKKNVYDVSTTSVVGINIVSIFRLSVILMKVFDPTIENDAYLFAKIPANISAKIPAKVEGFRGGATYNEESFWRNVMAQNKRLY